MITHIIVTIVWFSVTLLFASTLSWSNVGPNEFGDFLAGLFAPAAFYWLVVGFNLQRQELAITRKELARQADYLGESVESGKIEHLRADVKDALAQMPDVMFPVLENICKFGDAIRSPKDSDASFIFYHEAQVPKREERATKAFCEELEALLDTWAGDRYDKYGSLIDCLYFTNQGQTQTLALSYEELRSWYFRNFSKASSIGSTEFDIASEKCGLGFLVVGLMPRILNSKRLKNELWDGSFLDD